MSTANDALALNSETDDPTCTHATGCYCTSEQMDVLRQVFEEVSRWEAQNPTKNPADRERSI